MKNNARLKVKPKDHAKPKMNERTQPPHPWVNRAPARLRAVFRGDTPAFLLIVLAAGFIYLRDPRYFLQPRFWAEEGSLHFAYSFGHPVLPALFKPQLGYLNFWPNLATLLATFVPLELAPLITTLLAFAVQMLPIGLILFSRSPLWQSWGRKALGAAGVLFVPMTTEAWLNTINSFSYWGVIAFLILLEEPPEVQERRWVYRALLVLAGLTGTHACFLTPLFLYRAWDEKKVERWRQMLILLVCTIVQIGLILTYRGSDDIGQRFTLIGFSTLGSIVWTQSLAPFAIGFNNTYQWSTHLYGLQTVDLSLFHLWGRSLLVAAVVLFFLVVSNLPFRLRVVYLGSYGLLLLIPLLFSTVKDNSAFIFTGLAGRLFVAPNILLGWMLLASTKNSKEPGRLASTRRITALLGGTLLCVGLLWGFGAYWKPWVPASAWFNWPQEVQAWQADQDHLLRIQPEGWKVQLVNR